MLLAANEHTCEICLPIWIKCLHFHVLFFGFNSCKNGPVLKNKSEKSQRRNANKQVKKIVHGSGPNKWPTNNALRMLQANQTITNVVDVWIYFCSGTAKKGGSITRTKSKASLGYIKIQYV